MITSEQTSLLYELRQKPIPRAALAEVEFQLQERIHAMILDAFNKSGLSQKELAERLGWDTARVSRCLGSASNLTIKTVSALMAAIGVDLDDPSYTSFDELERRLRAPAHGPFPLLVYVVPRAQYSQLSAQCIGEAKLHFDVPDGDARDGDFMLSQLRRNPERERLFSIWPDSLGEKPHYLSTLEEQ